MQRFMAQDKSLENKANLRFNVTGLLSLATIVSIATGSPGTILLLGLTTVAVRNSVSDIIRK